MSTTMNSQVQSSLDSLESTLQTLLDSITSYNPSPTAASELLRADTSLTETLQQLELHQQNHHRIQTLRETTNTLDDHLTDLLTTLSEARTQLLAVPDHPPTPAAREIPYTDLLSYASKISKFSQPPNPAAFRRLTMQDAGAPADKPPLGLSEEDLLQLDPSSAMPFTPWPSEEEMKAGALVALNAAGGVPEDLLSEEERKALDGVGEANGVEEEVEERREVYGVQQVRPKKEAVSLSLDLYDPEEE